MLELSPFAITLLAAAVIAGLPHGAFDFYIAKRLGLWTTNWQLGIWLSRYLLTGLAFIVLWLLVPTLGLLLFLLVSALHFGRDHYPDSYLFATSLGLIILGLPMYFYPSEVATVFSLLYLKPEHASMLVDIFKGPLLLAAALISGIALYMRAVKPTRLCLLLATLSGLAAFFHPILYFAIFFALLHSPLHLYQQWQQISPLQRRSAIMVLTLLTLIPIAAAAILAGMMPALWTEKVITLVFIGLAALTMPHMLLLEQQYRTAGVKP